MSTEADLPTTSTHCPYLGIEASNHRLGEAVEYPSFENRCWTAPRPIPLLLTDQATLCLCSGYRHCPRYMAARAARHGQELPKTVPAPPADSDTISIALKELEADVQATGVAQTQSRRRWGWIGAGLIFMSSVLCGGLFAAYIGWQMVSEQYATIPPGNIDTLAASPVQARSAPQPQLYIVQTATTAPQPVIISQAPRQAQGQAAIGGTGGNDVIYPEAVAPTPIPPQVASNQPPPSLAEIAQASNATAVEQVGRPTPILDFQLEVPTRRPTPELDIPTSTPVLDSTPTPIPTSTPMPPLGTPIVIFYAEAKELKPEQCTTVAWHVENVKAVYYENLGVDGVGQKEECVHDDDGDYNLMVILGNGATQWYTVTVDLVYPTETPAPTPTRTEEPLPTATWTPLEPTATPTPDVDYGVNLEAGGDKNFTCARNSSCELDLYISNTGSAIDSMTLRFTEAGTWPRQICRLDGVCSESELTLVDMGPSNTGVIRLRITVPEDAGTDTMAYKLEATSNSSGGTTRSNITIHVGAADEPSTEETP